MYNGGRVLAWALRDAYAEMPAGSVARWLPSQRGIFMEEEKLSRRELKKIQSRRAILDSAASLFQSRGLDDVAIADIMSGANLGIGTFYNYFDSKDDVLMELLGRIMKELGERVRLLSEEKKPVTEILRELLLAAAVLLAKNRYVLPLFLRAAQQATLLKRSEASVSAPPFTVLFTRLVEEGQEQGEFRRDIPTAIISELFHSLFQAAAFSKLGLPFEENVRLKLGLILDGMRVIKSEEEQE